MICDGFALAGEGCASLPSDGCARTVVGFAAGADYVPYDGTFSAACGLYVPTLDLPEHALDALIEHVCEQNVPLLVRCAATLEEVGRLDARFSRSPVQLLHEFGLLCHATIIGGTFLDHDDLSLMAQEGVSLVLTPTADAGYGRGIPPVIAALHRGVSLRLGSDDGVYDPRRDILYEARVLRLLISAHMNTKDAVSAEALAKMCAPDATKEELAALASAL